MSLITLTTDFGTKDHFVGAVKGAIYSELPDARIVDITHQISPFSITETAYILKNSYKSFPDKSIQTCASVPLSDREIEIVRLVSKGMIAKEIGKKLHLSPHTVYTHRKNIMKKLKITNAPELVIYALNNGILSQ